MNIKGYQMSRFFCTECGKEGLPVFRNNGQKRKGGHLKKLYCPHCRKELNFVEIKDSYTIDDFKEEFKLGRFVDGNRTEVKDLKSCKRKCPFNKDGKCWNSNETEKCEERGYGK